MTDLPTYRCVTFPGKGQKSRIQEFVGAFIVDSMGNDKRIADVARVSFDRFEKGRKKEDDDRLIRFLANAEHTSPFRHVFLTFQCHAPIYIARQLVKHCVGMSWNEVSRRYVKDERWYHLPEDIRQQDANLKQGSVPGSKVRGAEDFLYQAYREADFAYEAMLGFNAAREQARMALPTALMTKWIWSGSLQGFAHAVRLRLAKDAQAECAPVMEPIRRELMRITPVAMEAFGLTEIDNGT